MSREAHVRGERGALSPGRIHRERLVTGRGWQGSVTHAACGSQLRQRQEVRTTGFTPPPGSPPGPLLILASLEGLQEVPPLRKGEERGEERKGQVRREKRGGERMDLGYTRQLHFL